MGTEIGIALGTSKQKKHSQRGRKPRWEGPDGDEVKAGVKKLFQPEREVNTSLN